MLTQCNLVEFFSGIGSQAKALKNLGIKVNTIGTSEWDVHAIVAYDRIHTSGEISEDISSMNKEELLQALEGFTFSNSGKTPLAYNNFKTYSVEALREILASVRRNKNYVDISQLDGTQLPGNIDILTYSFPCQDLSNVGAFHGYNKGIDKESGSRSSLIWQVGRILSEMDAAGISLPRYLVMENVPALLSNRHKKNFDIWINDLEALGYVSKYFQLNAASFGLPQNRPRLLMISAYVGDDLALKKTVLEYFNQVSEGDVVCAYQRSPFYHEYHVQDFLRNNYQDKELFLEALECTPNDTISRRTIWNDNPQIILSDNTFNSEISVVRTITTKQDRNPNSGNLYFDSGVEGLSKFRYLTPRECLLFMGFSDEDYCKLKKRNTEFHKGDAIFSRDKIIRMAGNSIPVKMLEGVFLQILCLENIILDYRKLCARTSWNEPYREYQAKRIRSSLYSLGIRCRIPNENYPHSADMVYPKYKTALYIRESLFFGNSSSFGTNDYSFDMLSEKMISCNKTKLMRETNEAIEMGWTAVVIWDCDLEQETYPRLVSWLEDLMRGRLQMKAQEGALLSYGE